MDKRFTVRGTLDDLSALVGKIEQDGRYVITSPRRLKKGLFERPVDAQLEILEIAIGFASNIVAAVAYDELKELISALKTRGNKSLNLDVAKEDDAQSPVDEGK